LLISESDIRGILLGPKKPDSGELEGVEKKETKKKINTKADNMRKQYTTLLQTYYEAMAQYSSYSAFNGTASTSSSSSSLLSSSGSLSGY